MTLDPTLLNLRGRPSLKSIPADCPTQVVVTCLTEGEGGAEIVRAVQKHGKVAIWLPFTIKTLTDASKAKVAEGADSIGQLLVQGVSVTIHCSAGLHRTGVVSYAALRRAGLDEAQALDAIGRLRPATARELPRFLALARTLANVQED